LSIPPAADLFLQILDRIELPTIDPADKERQKELQRLDGAKHRRQYSDLQLIRGAEPPARPGDYAVRICGQHAREHCASHENTLKRLTLVRASLTIFEVHLILLTVIADD
jgi:hypothetical protein